MYHNKLYGALLNKNPMNDRINMIYNNKSSIELIRDIVFGVSGNIDVYFDKYGTLQIKPYNLKDWETTGLHIMDGAYANRKFKFDTTNVVTEVSVEGVDEKYKGNLYFGSNLVHLNLASFFGTQGANISNPNQSNKSTSSKTTKTKTSTKKSTTAKRTLNPYGKKQRKIWIGADGGSGGFCQDIIKELNKNGWSCHYSGEGANVHYDDYFNVTKDYQIIGVVDNGFDPATVMEPYSGSIKSMLAKKGVICMFFFDSRNWTNPQGMKPYRYGDFKGYNARKAWDDNYSNFSGSLNVDNYFRNNNIKYCANPSAKGMVEQFLAGGYYEWKKGH